MATAAWHHEVMPDKDEETPEVSEEIAVNPDQAPVVLNQTSLALAEPETLIQGLRYLQGRIPDFEQLSLGERRSMTRVANLDPEFIEAGLQAADVYQSAKTILGRSGPELREEDTEIRRWDQVELELKALQSGIHSANLKRKRHLGEAILLLYSVLGSELRVSGGRYLRPYYENMKRAYLRSLKKGRQKKEKKDEE